MLPSKGLGNLLFWISSVAAITQADSVVDNLSFGVGKELPRGDKYGISGWQVMAEGHSPDILSDRIILTPPYPGGKRGALWASHQVVQTEWTAEFYFRANGEERGSGNLQLWLVKDGKANVGTASIYTVGPFDGLALTIDTHGGRGGSIRGFLNDGTKDYKNHVDVDSLSFGHCDHPYRNLGRPTRIRIKQSMTSFEVFVEDKTCFKTDKVLIPPGNSFGISAASADNPDSFEAFRFALSVPDSPKSNDGSRPYQSRNQPVNQGRSSNSNNNNNNNNNDGTADLQGQVNELQSRLTSLESKADTILTEVVRQWHKSEERQTELLQRMGNREQLSGVEQRLQQLNQMISAVQKEVQSKDYQSQFKTLQDTLQKSHSGLLEQVQSTSNMVLSSTPRMGLFIFFIIAFQVLLAGVYVFYKKRRANMPKKFL